MTWIFKSDARFAEHGFNDVCHCVGSLLLTPYSMLSTLRILTEYKVRIRHEPNK